MTLGTFITLATVAGAWLAYGILHSALAATRTKGWVARRWPRLYPRYRAVYNVTAAVTLLPMLWLLYTSQTPMLWRWQGALHWASVAAALLAVLGFMRSLRYYDMREFLGLRTHGPATLRISPLHRHVRHPWYALALLLIWTRDMDAAWLVSCVCMTLYLVAGARLEENKLIAVWGELYRDYRRQVPGLMPLPWRYLDRRAAAGLEQRAADQSRSVR